MKEYNISKRLRQLMDKLKMYAELYCNDIDDKIKSLSITYCTRAGKGQTIIEPTLDCWSREKRINNMVINDPKGELLRKFYVPFTYRGYEIIQFNLINSLRTDIFNPLFMAYTAARNGDFVKTQMYVKAIADVFFPVGGGEDPVWPNAQLTF